MILITQVEIKDEQGQQIVDAICERYGYTGFVEIEASPISITIEDKDKEKQTKQEFLQGLVLKYLYSEFKSHVSSNAGKEAQQTKEEQVDIDVKSEIIEP